MITAEPSVSLISTLVLAFVVGEFVLADLIRGDAARRLASLALYVPAALWPWSFPLYLLASAPILPLLALLAAFAGILAWSDWLVAGRPAMNRRYTALALKAAALGALLAVLTSGGIVGPLPLGLPVLAVKVMLWAAAYLFVLPGGTALVRYVLDAASPTWSTSMLARPRRSPSPGSADIEVAAGADQRQKATVDGGKPAEDPRKPAGDGESGATAALRPGRVIGNVERLIVTTLVTLGQFGAIGLVLTAKSLARFPQLSNSRDFAEYYLIGTLVSVAVAMGTGLLLAAALAGL